jgi:hypothetical protein
VRRLAELLDTGRGRRLIGASAAVLGLIGLAAVIIAAAVGHPSPSKTRVAAGGVPGSSTTLVDDPGSSTTLPSSVVAGPVTTTGRSAEARLPKVPLVTVPPQLPEPPGGGGPIAVTQHGSNGAEIDLIMSDGSGRTKVADGNASNPRWSPDHLQLAFAGGDMQLWVASATGTNLRRLTNSPIKGLDDLAWSPDGLWIETLEHPASGAVLAVVRVADGLRHESTVNDSDWDFGHWAPDSSAVSFQSGNSAGTGDMYVLTTSGVTRMLPGTTGNFNVLSWSPAGEALYTPGDQIWAVAPDGNSQPHVLFSDASTVGWSADLTRALVGHNGDHMRIVGPDGLHRIDVQGGGAWSTHGHRLALNLADGLHIMDAVTGATTGPLHSGGMNFLVWSPDDTYLAAMTFNGSGTDNPPLASFAIDGTHDSTVTPQVLNWGHGRQADW